MNQAEKYCENCKTSKVFYYTMKGTRMECGGCGRLYTREELVNNFISLSKDPEYAEKGTSYVDAEIDAYRSAYEKHIHTMKKLAPNDVSKTLTLPIDSEERKGYPLLSGCLKYFAAALASVARTSKLGNDKHNPGQPLHHARGKSMDHGDCIIRHLMDIEDLLAARERGNTFITNRLILDEAGSLAWRALAYSQELHERLGAAPLAPGAKET